jgi:TrmH family RNA methyltransferase
LPFKEKDNPRTMETNSVVFFNSANYPKLPEKPVIAAWQIINPENIGHLIRLADNLGAEDVFVIGKDFQLRMSSVKKTAGLSFNHVRLTFISPEDFFNQIDPEFTLVAIETSESSSNIFTANLPKKIVFMLGNERHGVPEEILNKCELKVHIPMTGKCKSMNVSHALSVALFEWQRQMLFKLMI